MPATIRLDHRGPITYSSALRKNADVINKATHLAAAEELCRVLWDSRGTIESLVRHHLWLGDRDSCTVAPCDRWIRGGFNVCVPVETRSGGAHSVPRRLIFRCPMPHKLAEARYPGTVDEKLSCEVGTYAWMQDWCPDVRIPHLYGFGFSDHRHVGRLDFAPPTSSSALTSSSDSSHMSDECRFTFASGAQSDATSAASSGTRPSHATPPTPPACIFPPHICCSSTLARIRGVCFLTHGGSAGPTRPSSERCSEATVQVEPL